MAFAIAGSRGGVHIKPVQKKTSKKTPKKTTANEGKKDARIVKQ